MYLLKGKSKTTIEKQSGDFWYVHRLRQTGKILDPEQIKIGEYYLYKEKFGMVSVVKVIEDTSNDGWVGFRLLVKRVLYSSCQVPKGTVIETGYYRESFSYPTSWHFEPGMTLIQSKNQTHNAGTEDQLESVL